MPSSPATRLPERLRPREALQEYPVRLERMEGEIMRRNGAFPEIASLSETQILDFAHFAVDPENPNGVWVDHRPGHNRSFVFSENSVLDENGNDYGKINIKGTGFVSLGGVGPVTEAFKGHHIFPELRRRILRPKKKISSQKHVASEKVVFGLMSLEDATIDYDNGERLHALGIRTSRGIAIIKLKTIFYPGKGIVEVETLKKEGVIPHNFDPVVYVRATGSDHRIRDYEDPEFFPRSNRSWLRKRKAEAFSSALKRVSKEIGKEGITIEEYVKWFAQTLGRQIGILHKNGYVHQGLHKRPTGYVHPVDITLDCRLVDLDNVDTLESIQNNLRKLEMTNTDPRKMLEIKKVRDVEAAKHSLKALVKSCQDVESIIQTGTDSGLFKKKNMPSFNAHIMEIFDRAYQEVVT